MGTITHLLNKFSNKPLTWLFIGSFLVLGTAYVFQYLGYHPCEMCYWQRYPYMAVIALGFLGAGHEKGIYSFSSSIAKGLLGVIVLLLFVDAGIAAFHAGVEYGWWEGLTACTAPVDMTGTPEEVLEQIMNAPLIRCDVPAWTMFGISMAGYNFFAALGLAGFGLFSFKKGLN